MSKWLHDDVIDAALLEIADNGDRMHVCTSQPATYAAAVAASLGYVAMTKGDGAGDYVVANGDASGRKLTVATQTAAITVQGTGNHIAIVDVTNTKLLAVDTLPDAAVNIGDALAIAAFDTPFIYWARSWSHHDTPAKAP